MREYTTEAKIENYLLTDIDSSFSSAVTDWIESVSLHIEQVTGRQFIADATATARKFVGDETNKLLIDDCISITTVETGDLYGEEFTATTDYLKFPLNYSEENKPITKLLLKNSEWGVGVHRITAKWGYSEAVPEDIEFVATVLTAGIINNERKTAGAKKSEKIGNYSVAFVDDRGVNDYKKAMSILTKYKRYYL